MIFCCGYCPRTYHEFTSLVRHFERRHEKGTTAGIDKGI